MLITNVLIKNCPFCNGAFRFIVGDLSKRVVSPGMGYSVISRGIKYKVRPISREADLKGFSRREFLGSEWVSYRVLDVKGYIQVFKPYKVTIRGGVAPNL